MSDRRRSQRSRYDAAGRSEQDGAARPDVRRPDPDLPGTPATLREEIEGAQGEAAAAAAGRELTGRRGSLWADAWRELRRNPTFVVSSLLIVVFVVMAVWPGLFTSFYPGFDDPRRCDLSRALQRPSAEHWFGFDIQGCDYYAQVIHGARVSVLVGVTVVVFAAMIAVVFGSVAGYFGRFTDALIARVADVWFAIPVILGGLIGITVLRQAEAAHPLWRGVLAFLGAIDDLTNVPGFGAVVFILVLLGWPTMLRLMRSSVLERKEDDYVDAARALGASDLRIVVRHILPNAIQPVIVYGTIFVGIMIVVEATLSFLGAGLQLPAISWGLMLSRSQFRILSAPHLLAFPAIFLSTTVFAFILLGDALRDALDPKLR